MLVFGKLTKLLKWMMLPFNSCQEKANFNPNAVLTIEMNAHDQKLTERHCSTAKYLPFSFPSFSSKLVFRHQVLGATYGVGNALGVVSTGRNR